MTLIYKSWLICSIKKLEEDFTKVQKSEDVNFSPF